MEKLNKVRCSQKWEQQKKNSFRNELPTFHFCFIKVCASLNAWVLVESFLEKKNTISVEWIQFSDARRWKCWKQNGQTLLTQKIVLMIEVKMQQLKILFQSNYNEIFADIFYVTLVQWIVFANAVPFEYCVRLLASFYIFVFTIQITWNVLIIKSVKILF